MVLKPVVPGIGTKYLRTMAVTTSKDRTQRGSCGAADIASRQTNTGRLEGQCRGVCKNRIVCQETVQETNVAGGAIQVLVCNYIKICGKERKNILG
jgi:hypothetical protein